MEIQSSHEFTVIVVYLEQANAEYKPPKNTFCDDLLNSVTSHHMHDYPFN